MEGIWAMVALRLQSADIPGSLEALCSSGICIFRLVQEDPLTVRLALRRRDFRRAAAVLKKRGDTVTLLRRVGAYWTAKSLLRRPVLLAGCLLLIFLTLWVPSRVFFIRVEGNQQVQTRQILEAASECGIHFGASRRLVRSEGMKNRLLEAMPELKWAGVNTSGCVAVITVTEREEPRGQPQLPPVGSIIACRDGIIVSCTATAGNLLCVPGQAVQAGQVLISAYTQEGNLLRMTLAQGEVFAQTIRNLRVVTPTQVLSRGKMGHSEKKFSLILGKNRINFWKDSGICGTTCGRMYEEYYVTLPGGFVLPVGLGVETWQFWQTEPWQPQPSQTDGRLSAFAAEYLGSQMIAGRILERQEQLQEGEGFFCLEGTYLCTEMIGRVRSEQIGE